jgi:protein disulfide-isomerase A1
MKWIILLAYLFCLVHADDEVLVLNDDNFEQTIGGTNPVFVKFYAPWCGHCKALAPEYIKLAETVKQENLPFVIAEIDATTSPNMARKYGISGYPTIKFFLNGLAIDYNKERKIDAMIEFMKKKSAPASEELKDAAEVKAKLEDKNRRCILVSDNLDDLQKYMNTGRIVEEFKFYHTSERVGKEVFPEIEKPSIVLLKDFGEKKIVYTGSFEHTEFEAFLRKNQFDIVTILDHESSKPVFSDGDKVGVFLIVAADNPTEEQEKMLRKLAEKRQSDKYMFLFCTKGTEMGKRFFSFFGIEEADAPLIEIIEGKGKPTRYRHTGKLTVDEISKFMDDFEAKKLEVFIKSEPIPESNPGPVYTVVAKNFKEMIMNDDKDVFVKYYAPWCGHCKALAPIFVELAESLKHNPNLRIAEIDATKNDIEGVRITAYPTLYLYQAGKKKNPKKYEGERTLEEMTKFLQENCVNKLENKKSDL